MALRFDKLTLKSQEAVQRWVTPMTQAFEAKFPAIQLEHITTPTTDESTQKILAMFAANDPDGYAESALATARGKMIEPERVLCHAFAFAGSEDPVTPPSGAKEIAAAMPRGEFVTVPGGSHWCHMEVPSAVSEKLLEFLRRAAIG